MQRINQPAEILAGPMLVVATIGLVVNLIGAYALWSGDSGDSNLRGALLHVVGDLLGKHPSSHAVSAGADEDQSVYGGEVRFGVGGAWRSGPSGFPA